MPIDILAGSSELREQIESGMSARDIAQSWTPSVNAFMRVPCQLVRTGRRLIFRLLSWNRWQSVLLRGMDALTTPLQC